MPKRRNHVRCWAGAGLCNGDSSSPAPVSAKSGNQALTVNIHRAQQSLWAPRFWGTIGLLWCGCIQAQLSIPCHGHHAGRFGQDFCAFQLLPSLLA